MKRQKENIFMKEDNCFKQICTDHFYLLQYTQLLALHELQDYCITCKKYTVLSKKSKVTDIFSVQEGNL